MIPISEALDFSLGVTVTYIMEDSQKEKEKFKTELEKLSIKYNKKYLLESFYFKL